MKIRPSAKVVIAIVGFSMFAFLTNIIGNEYGDIAIVYSFLSGVGLLMFIGSILN